MSYNFVRADKFKSLISSYWVWHFTIFIKASIKILTQFFFSPSNQLFSVHESSQSLIFSKYVICLFKVSVNYYKYSWDFLLHLETIGLYWLFRHSQIQNSKRKGFKVRTKQICIKLYNLSVVHSWWQGHS